LEECRVAQEDKTVREVFVDVSRPGRRTGAIMLTDENGLLTGIFTDSDLARLLETRRDRYIDGPIREVMTRGPRSVRSGSAMGDALDVLAERKISELPVVDADGRPLGLLDITDVVGLLPRDMSAADSAATLPADGTEQRDVVPLVG
jgi:arabinose-5-phosphate isomerase